MALTSGVVKDLTLSLFKQESERDKQKKVGASNISDPCTRHLAHAMIGAPEAPSKYWMGGKIGTAIHSFIESAIERSDDGILAGSLIEQKITLGEVPGYGVISSKPDLVLTSSSHLIDWKTTSRAKVKKIRNLVDGIKYDAASEYTMQKYIAQAMLYVWGLNQAGHNIDAVSIVFINRDGTSDDDIFVHTVPYDESVALALWDRLVALWAELENGAHPNDYPGNENCYKCAMGI